jgi:hypothetical protein
VIAVDFLLAIAQPSANETALLAGRVNAASHCGTDYFRLRLPVPYKAHCRGLLH